MADNNNNKAPRGRQQNITGQGKDVYKRGDGLGTGPVGNAGGDQGRPGTQSSRPAQTGGNQTGRTTGGSSFTRAAGRIALGLQDHLELGNLDSLRDWGYAKDYVECMWLILQQDEPDDYVIATGVQHTVREFTTLAFAHDGIEIEWKGEGINEKGYDKKTGKMVVCVNEKWYRPTDVVNLWGDPTKARTKLGWNPQKTSYEELCAIMAEHDLKLAKQEAGLA